MKLLVADYDGTFKSNIKNLNINIYKVNEFMKKGNKFVIATGREYKSLEKEIKKFNIKYDYLICNNGLIIFDNKGNIVHHSRLLDDDLDFFYRIFNIEKIHNIKLYDFFSSTTKNKNILEILIRFEDSKSAIKFKEYLESIKNNIHCYYFDKNIFIGNYATKATAIKKIEKIENIKSEDIYTIGNDINDIEMLQEYNGYKMLNSNKRLWFKSIPTVRQVYSLTKKIMKSSK